VICIWKDLPHQPQVQASSCQYQAEFSIAATGVTSGTKNFFSLVKNYPCFSLIEKCFYSQLNLKTWLRTAGPKVFSWKLSPDVDTNMGFFDDNGRYYFTLDWIFKLTVLIYIKQHPGPEPDLTATLPMDPREYTDAFSPPIVLPSQKRSAGEWYTTFTHSLIPRCLAYCPFPSFVTDLKDQSQAIIALSCITCTCNVKLRGFHSKGPKCPKVICTSG